MLLSGICNRTIPLFFLDFSRYLRGRSRVSRRREDSCFQRAVWLRQPPRYPFFPQLIISWLRHRRESIDGDFAIDSSRSIDTALAPPPSCPLFQGSPSANALAARELLVTSPTYRYARTHARIARSLAHAHAHLYTCTRNTHADRARVLYSERKVRPRGRMRAWGTSVSTSIKPRFRGLGLIFCLVLFILFLRRRRLLLLLSALFQPLRTS